MRPAVSSGSSLAEQPSARRRGSATLSVVLAGAIVLLALAGGLAQSLLPGTLVGRDAPSVVAAVIFAASYLALAVGRIPGLAIDRAGVALVGACLMVADGALPVEDAYKAVDLDTLTLLLGMMIVVANLRLSGFFAQASAWVMRRAHYPLALLAAVTAVAGVFSAFLAADHHVLRVAGDRRGRRCSTPSQPRAGRAPGCAVETASAPRPAARARGRSRRFIDPLSDQHTAWLTVAMASTLAGNFTVLGSMANLIVVQRAAVSGVEIGFWDYFKVGAPLTLLTLLIGTLWLWL